MDFMFSAEQDALRASVRSFLTDKAPSAYVRSMLEDERGFTDDVWAGLAELGVVDLINEGGGLVDMAVVLEEMGKLPLPGPFFSAAVLTPLAARHLGIDLPPGRGTLAFEELGHGDPVERVRTRAHRKAARWLITGDKPLVLDGHTADYVLIAARTDSGLATFLMEAPSASAVPTLDPSRKAAGLELRDAAAERVGPAGDQTALWRRIADDAAVALCAELVGSCERALELATEYAKVRVQFDRPIATFQAIKHKAAEMLQQLELLRVGTHYAAWTSDVDDPDRERAAAMAKGYAGEAAVAITGECVQIHGGVGFTWDCDAHLHYRRAKAADLMLGYQGWQRQRLADLALST
jgi:alkylation response protein AidB-like acyl-CoA dehydrogenase